MRSVNVALPDPLKSFVDEQVADRGYETSGDYIRDLIRRDRDREQLRALLLEGASSPATAPVDDPYFAGLRERVRNHRSE